MTARCRACNGTGQQVAADQTVRPCSRCDGEGFARWSAERAPKPAIVLLHTNTASPKGGDA
jgi:DnaJ-class molecular chaperone